MVRNGAAILSGTCSGPLLPTTPGNISPANGACASVTRPLCPPTWRTLSPLLTQRKTREGVPSKTPMHLAHGGDQHPLERSWTCGCPEFGMGAKQYSPSSPESRRLSTYPCPPDKSCHSVGARTVTSLAQHTQVSRARLRPFCVVRLALSHHEPWCSPSVPRAVLPDCPSLSPHPPFRAARSSGSGSPMLCARRHGPRH
ncbi:uncharacterized protein B0I36DRAFT_89527 [Microdochium trichocladiopsis]|uniref:Uncharacterized protein n=1 Tax=Microdochium trichocladiopsis TaxID=1682393 RepID=A0A9P9BSU4_9PEZI|nr:uncharacterized protein B0I36DRAFT_89527 [Microdochium trichocladiopsis]KAH7035205.1 hypothetical protein B0I36DRAFT_89527 [Microdochium trichocladiopsis]